MTAVLAVVALVLAVLLVVAAIAGSRTRAAQREAAGKAADAADRLAASRRQLTEVQAELATTRDALAQAEAAAAPPQPVIPPGPVAEPEAAGEAISHPDDIVGSLWTLERLELDVHRRRQAAVTPDAVSTYDTVLGGALEREVERIREEVGTPGELHSDIGADPDEEIGLVVLGAVRRTLAAVARGCEAYDLYVKSEHGRLQVKVVCELFDGAWMDDTASDVGAVAAAVAPAGATAVFRPGDEGAAVAELSFRVE